MRPILSVSIEPSLLYTRGLVLERSGAAVRSARPKAALQLLAENCDFGVIVLCHSLPGDIGEQLCAAARTCKPPIWILLIESRQELPAAGIHPDVRFTMEDGPELLVKAVVALLADEKSAAETSQAERPERAVQQEQATRVLPFRPAGR